MQGTTHLNLNSGFFYLQSNGRTIDLMKRIAARLAKETSWDQVLCISLSFYVVNTHDAQHSRLATEKCRACHQAVAYSERCLRWK